MRKPRFNGEEGLFSPTMAILMKQFFQRIHIVSVNWFS
jgi:hypothetical protein